MTVKIDGTNTVANPAFTGADTDTGLQCGTNELKLVTGGSTRATVDSSGDVQARRARSNTAGDVALSVQPSDSTIHYGLRIDSANNNLNLDRASGTAAKLLTIDSSGDVGIGATPNSFSNYTTVTLGGSAATTGSGIDLENSNGEILGRFFADSNGIQIATAQTNDDIRFETAGGLEKARILAGGGLTFNGDTAQTNALKDYEEGTWAPGVNIGTCTASDAKYIKIGKFVKVCATITGFSDRTTATILQINNVPFASSTVAQAAGSMFGRYLDRTAYTSYVKNNGSVVEFYSIGAGNFAPLQHQHLNNASSLLYLEASWIIN
jgi:hypothetical protein